MTDKKKSWIEPELIAIVRNKPEEAVLWTCKGSPATVTPNNYAGFCSDPAGPGCGKCSGPGAS